MYNAIYKLKKNHHKPNVEGPEIFILFKWDISLVCITHFIKKKNDNELILVGR